MARQASNILLQKAKKSKNDEFYTQLCDIERELQYYQDCFRDKIVYCNCDEPRVSNFFRYFKDKFHTLGLKKLIASFYKNQSAELFQLELEKRPYYCVYDGMNETIKYFSGDGDFRSA